MTEIMKGMIAAIGIDIGKNWFHVVGLDGRGAVALRQKWSRGQVEHGSPICRAAWSAWRPVSGRIISAAGSVCLAMMPG